MYNGIGLATVRGSGTNGYVQRNFSHVNKKNRNLNEKYNDDLEVAKRGERMVVKQANEEILEHERKRQIESKCLEKQMELEDDGMDDAEIEKVVNELRERLYATTKTASAKLNTHSLAAEQQKRNEKLKGAFAIRDDFVEGSSFDKEAQTVRKEKRHQEWEERQSEKKAKAEEEGRKYRAPRDNGIRGHHDNRMADTDTRDKRDEDKRSSRGREKEAKHKAKSRKKRRKQSVSSSSSSSSSESESGSNSGSDSASSSDGASKKRRSTKVSGRKQKRRSPSRSVSPEVINRKPSADKGERGASRSRSHPQSKEVEVLPTIHPSRMSLVGKAIGAGADTQSKARSRSRSRGCGGRDNAQTAPASAPTKIGTIHPSRMNLVKPILDAKDPVSDRRGRDDADPERTRDRSRGREKERERKREASPKMGDAGFVHPSRRVPVVPKAKSPTRSPSPKRSARGNDRSRSRSRGRRHRERSRSPKHARDTAEVSRRSARDRSRTRSASRSPPPRRRGSRRGERSRSRETRRRRSRSRSRRRSRSRDRRSSRHGREERGRNRRSASSASGRSRSGSRGRR
ncbi:hypothetical protein SARC_02604 [Sphaeroforma arctica JP610]|uniref:CWF21 domain-containing protein n=1 Tax=Sphaeroforma arctica JP610 TaxID=667725 RepID=A0A0L0G8F1_9EUKA|nr:hypothetical protein SARC_02604 [Sphaeroforma arctica JP610]KNC85184.1 hypothetical protein SARC_02604 [Sphaeroforma arctica JP610]|eukprot:XP_014159086.1 hypothetical protein SARC_02604 [Sphaeroforma arctica JP610]